MNPFSFSFGGRSKPQNAYLRLLYCLAVTGALSSGCTQGAGEGFVQSDALFVRDCWNGQFDLQPSFFGANPFSSSQMAIRVQRGDDNQEVSDGLSVMIYDVQKIRSELNTDIEVGLPSGVSPPGMPVRINPNPPIVALSLYLHDSCHAQNGAIYAIGGTINFENLFSGNANETDSGDRLTEAFFDDIQFADPRDMNTDYTVPDAVTSHVRGRFRFYFQRGQPAQPFP